MRSNQSANAQDGCSSCRKLDPCGLHFEREPRLFNQANGYLVHQVKVCHLNCVRHPHQGIFYDISRMGSQHRLPTHVDRVWGGFTALLAQSVLGKERGIHHRHRHDSASTTSFTDIDICYTVCGLRTWLVCCVHGHTVNKDVYCSLLCLTSSRIICRGHGYTVILLRPTRVWSVSDLRIPQ